jgi:hypothetical protein
MFISIFANGHDAMADEAYMMVQLKSVRLIGEADVIMYDDLGAQVGLQTVTCPATLL